MYVDNGVVKIIPRSSPCQLMFCEVFRFTQNLDLYNEIGKVLRPKMLLDRPVGQKEPITETYIYKNWMKCNNYGIAWPPVSRVAVPHDKTFWVYVLEDDERDAEYMDIVSALNWADDQDPRHVLQEQSRKGERIKDFFLRAIKQRS